MMPFSKDWVERKLPRWRRWFGHLAGRAGLRILEIGVYEGRSAVYWLTELATASSARVDLVDPWGGPKGEEPYHRTLANLAESDRRARATVSREASMEFLLRSPPNRYDLIYIDGGHEGRAALADSLLACRTLKPAGLLLWDDYGWDEFQGTQRPPRPAIDAFLDLHGDQLELIHKDWQALVRKMPRAVTGTLPRSARYPRNPGNDGP